jgi:TRAP transporter TAXI family solute receptor
MATKDTVPDSGQRELTRVWGTVTVLSVVGFLVAYQFVEPAPPDTLVLATGSEQGGYHAHGRRYAEELAAYGVTVHLRTTAGALENLELLASGEVDVAFVQGGTVRGGEARPLESIASVYYEPLWIAHRAGLEVDEVRDLAGLRLSLGAPGSGTRAVAEELLAANGITPEHTAGEGPLAQQLLEGTVDAVFLVMAPENAAVHELVARDGEGLVVLDMQRWLGTVRTLPYLAHVVLAEGVLDLERDVPTHDIDLLAPTAALLTTEDLHPALVPAFIQAAEAIHGGGDLLSAPDSFPSPHHLEAPLAPAADRYFEHGLSFFYRVLPFGLAAALDRLKILLLPLLTLLIPLMKVAPPIYRWGIRSKIYRWYVRVGAVEQRFLAAGEDADPAPHLSELDALQREIRETVKVPASYMEELHNLRMHLGRVREDMARGESA